MRSVLEVFLVCSRAAAGDLGGRDEPADWLNRGVPGIWQRGTKVMGMMTMETRALNMTTTLLPEGTQV